MSENKNKSLSFASLALALANDYSSLYVIDSDDDSYVEYAPSGSDKELVMVSSGSNFYEDVPHNCRELVYKDDQEFFLNAFKRENVMNALEVGRSFSLTYRLVINGEPKYFFLKTIRGDDSSIIIGVRDIDAEKRRQLANEQKNLAYAEIAQSLASLFEIIYHIDIATGQYICYSAGDKYSNQGFGMKGDNFFEQAKHDVQQVMHPDDCEYVLKELDRDTLIDNLHANGTVSITYRQVIDGQPIYVNLLAFIQNNDTEHIVIGVRNIDAQKKREAAGETYSHIAGSLASRYEVIYYINTDTNEYTLYSASEEYAKLGTTKQGKDFFADADRDVKAYIHPDDVKRTLKQLAKDKLLKDLSKTGSVTLTYRQLLGDRQQHMNMLVVQPKNDNHHIVIGVFNTDEQVRKEQLIRAESQTFSDISMALAQRYEVIYHVNIITNEYSEYSASDKYSKLKVGTKGKDFFKETQVNMQRDIYPEDLPMMSLSMKKENLLNSLDSFGKTFLNYRLMLDGRPQYVSLYAVRPKEDSEHIIIAVANVDAAKRMEIAYQNAMDMANKDALTCVKNKRAYVQAETDLDEQIKNFNQSPFAIVVCDVNGLKQVNDTKGHKAGDDFIRSACTIICTTFKHSPVFRIGGDEFAVILKGHDYEQRHELMEQLGRVLEEQKYNGVALLASGISDFDAEKDMRVQDVFERADALMYADKEICKQLQPNVVR